ncbi:MAG TPA: GAF domain-containing protein [Usitatibacter sp.]|nr:GAF domain-containing protein [Usitatibacter sp.]
MTLLLDPMIGRLRRHTDLRSLLDQAVADVVALHGGEFGNLQLRVPDGSLVLVAHARLKRDFLESFLRVTTCDRTVCMRAARAGAVVIVEDIFCDAEFSRYLDRTRTSPFRCVLSAPLATTRGVVVGVVSAHFARRYRPTPVELSSLESYCRHLADRVEAMLADCDIELTAARLSEEMLALAA